METNINYGQSARFDSEVAESKENIYPVGMIQAVCSGVYDLGIQRNSFTSKAGKTKVSHKRGCIVLFELNFTDEEGERVTVNKWYNTISFSTDPEYKSKLQKDIESWRVKPFSEDEIDTHFNLYNLYGKNATLNIIKGKKYADVQAVMPTIPDLKPLLPVRGFGDVPDWVVKIIDKQESPDEISEPKDTPKPEQQAVTRTTELPPNDDIPF